VSLPDFGSSQGAAPPPVCPRHPDRISYVRCQRCGRPVCAECQRPASVGVQCVDCVARAEQAAQAARPSGRFGAAPTAPRTAAARRRAGKPVVTYALLGIMVVVFLLQQLTGTIDLLFGFWPGAALAAPWQFLTAGFLHGSILHILFNGYALYICGQFLEPVLGRARFLAVFLVSVLAGHVLYLLAVGTPLGPDWGTSYVVGASGGVFGLFAAMFVVQRKLGGQATQILVLLAINLVYGFVVSNVAWQGHVGGLLVGGLLTWLYGRFRTTPTDIARRRTGGAAPAAGPVGVGTDERVAARRTTTLVHVVITAFVVILLLMAAAAKYVLAAPGL
jgi:membrane associated rhomboid family serine protease